MIKDIVSYINPKIKIKSGTLKTLVNSTQRAKYFEDHFKSVVNANYIIFGDNFKLSLYIVIHTYESYELRILKL